MTILFGTDSGPNFITPGVSVLEEMKLLKNAGVSSFEILKSATINAGKVLNNENLGIVSVNAVADILVLDKNPMENLGALSSLNFMLSNGMLYSSIDLISIRDLGEEKQNGYATIGLFLEHLINK